MTPPTFTPSQLTDMRVACAEAAGVCPHLEMEHYCIEDGNSLDSGYTCKKCGTDSYRLKRPDWPTDREAMVDLIAGLKGGQKAAFNDLLWSEFKDDPKQFYSLFYAATAPVPTLCACYLRAVGRWEALEAKWRAEG